MKFTKDDTLAIKGIAILLMMVHHCFMGVDRFKGFHISFYPFNQEDVVSFSMNMKICVGIFVFLSAYGLTLSLKKYSTNTLINSNQYCDYLNSRLIKLMWGFWFVFIVGQIASIFINQAQVNVYFQNGIVQGISSLLIDFFGLANLFGTPTLCGTWWYMTLAIFIVLIVPFVAKITEKYNYIFAILVTLFIPRIFMLANELKIGQISISMKWLMAVVLGVIFAQNDYLARLKSLMITKNRFVSKTIKFIIATGILVAMLYARDRFGGDYSNFAYEFRDSIVPVYVVYYCYEFIVGIPIIRTILKFIGIHSMNIFLFHTFYRVYWCHSFIYSFKHFGVVIGALLGISILSSIVMELIKKLIRYNNLMNFVVKKIQAKFGRCSTVQKA